MTRKPPVLNKPDFYRRWQANEFGNRLGSWSSIDEAEADGFMGPTFSIRSTIPGWPFFEMLLPWPQRKRRWKTKVLESGADEKTLRCCEDDGGQHATLQGHLWCPRSDRFELEYTGGKDNLRAEYGKGFTLAVGLRAHYILKERLDPCDYESLLELLELYPEHVIEFTSYRHPVGLLKKCLVIWEVRLY